MEDALQQAMRLKQTQMDRDRAKFLKSTRPLQNSLFHGLYGGKEGGGDEGAAAPSSASSTAKNNNKVVTTSSSSSPSPLTAPPGNGSSSVSGSGHTADDVDNNNTPSAAVDTTQENTTTASSSSGATAACDNTLVAAPTAAASADVGSSKDVVENVPASATTVTTSSGTKKGRGNANNNATTITVVDSTEELSIDLLEIKAALGMILSSSASASASSAPSTTADDKKKDEEDDTTIEDINDHRHPMHSRLALLKNLHALENRLRVVGASGVTPSASSSAASSSASPASVASPASRNYLRLLFLRTMITNAGALIRSSSNNSKNGNNGELSTAIDLLESGYATLGYLTPVPNAATSSSAASASAGSSSAASKPKTDADTNPNTGGVDAIRDESVVFHPLSKGVMEVAEELGLATTSTTTTTTSNNSINSINTTADTNSTTTPPNSTSSFRLSSLSTTVHAFLIALGSQIGKEAEDPQIAQLLLGAGGDGDGDDDTDGTATSSSSSSTNTVTTIQRLLSYYAQVGSLSDLSCNLAICYTKEDESRASSSASTVHFAAVRDEEAEEVLAELLMPLRQQQYSGTDNDDKNNSSTVIDGIVSALTASSPATSASSSTSSSPMPISPHHLRATYLLAKSIGCSASSSTVEARKAVGILNSAVGAMEGLLVPSSPSSGDGNGGGDVVTETILKGLQSKIAAISAASAASAAPDKKDASTNTNTNTNTNSTKESSAAAVLAILISLLQPFIKRTVELLTAQLKDCITLRDTLQQELDDADAKLKKQLLKAAEEERKRKQEDEEEKAAALARKKELLEGAGKFEIEDDTLSDASPSNTKKKADDDDDEIVDFTNTPSLNSNNTKTQSVGVVVRGGSKIPTPASVIPPNTGDDASSPIATPPIDSAIASANKRREQMEFTLRQEIARKKKDLVTAVYKNLFQSAEDDDDDEDDEYDRKKSGDGSSNNSNKSRRVLRFQSLSEQPQHAQQEYRRHIQLYYAARRELLVFLCRRLFSSVMLPTKCFRLTPFAINNTSATSSKKASNNGNSGGITIDSLPASLSGSSNTTTEALFNGTTSPITKDEYSAWVAVYIAECMRKEGAPATTNGNITATTSPNLIKLLQGGTRIGLNLVGPYDPREEPSGIMGHHHVLKMAPTTAAGNTDSAVGVDTTSTITEEEYDRLFTDAVASITQPNLFARQQQQEYLWASWEVRAVLRRLVYEYQYPTESLDERVAKLGGGGNGGGSSDENTSSSSSPSSSSTSSAADQQHRFSLMASGVQHSKQEMEISKAFFMLHSCEEEQRLLALPQKGGSAAGSGDDQTNNATVTSSSSSSFFNYPKKLLSSLCLQAHDAISTFLGSNSHDERVTAAIVDANRRLDEIRAMREASGVAR